MKPKKAGDTVELNAGGMRLIARPARRPRKGWGRAFAAMAARRDDTLLDGETLRPTEWDKTGWCW